MVVDENIVDGWNKCCLVRVYGWMIFICLDLLVGWVLEWVDLEIFLIIYFFLKIELGVFEWMMDELFMCDLDCNCFVEIVR